MTTLIRAPLYGRRCYKGGCYDFDWFQPYQRVAISCNQRSGLHTESQNIIRQECYSTSSLSRERCDNTVAPQHLLQATSSKLWQAGHYPLNTHLRRDSKFQTLETDDGHTQLTEISMWDLVNAGAILYNHIATMHLVATILSSFFLLNKKKKKNATHTGISSEREEIAEMHMASRDGGGITRHAAGCPDTRLPSFLYSRIWPLMLHATVIYARVMSPFRSHWFRLSFISLYTGLSKPCSCISFVKM